MLSFHSLISMIVRPHACIYICENVQLADSCLPMCIGSIPLACCAYSRMLHSITYSMMLELICSLYSRGRGNGLARVPVQPGTSLCISAMLHCVSKSLRLWPGLRLCASLGILDTLKNERLCAAESCVPSGTA